MKIKLLILIIFGFSTYHATAQLDISPSLFSGRDIVFNPAYTGSEPGLTANLNAKRFFTGFKSAPQHYGINIHSRIGNVFENGAGVGLILENETWGIQNGFTALGTYAYHLNLGFDTEISFGIQAGVIHNSIFWRELQNVGDRDDPWLSPDNWRKTKFDASFGVQYSMPGFLVGVSAMHLTHPQFHFVDESLEYRSYYNTNKISLNLFSKGSIGLSESAELVMSGLLTVNEKGKVSGSIAALFRFVDVFGLGVEWQQNMQTINLCAGLDVLNSENDKMRIQYSYGIHYGPLLKYQSGTHEITMKYVFIYNAYRYLLDRPRY